jgi:hypothetical protein
MIVLLPLIVKLVNRNRRSGGDGPEGGSLLEVDDRVAAAVLHRQNEGMS